VHGVQLLDHMLTFAKRRLPRGERLQPSDYLNVAMTADQQMLLDPTPEDLLIRNVLSDAGGDGATSGSRNSHQTILGKTLPARSSCSH
jgi:hypothetical protein